MERIAKLFADNLRFFRGRAGLTQEALSERLNLSSITISNYESGRRWPEPETLTALAGALGVGVSDLFTDRAKRPRPTLDEALGVLMDALERAQPYLSANPERRMGYRVINSFSAVELKVFLAEHRGFLESDEEVE